MLKIIQYTRYIKVLQCYITYFRKDKKKFYGLPTWNIMIKTQNMQKVLSGIFHCNDYHVNHRILAKKEKKIIVSTKFHYVGFLRSVQSWQTFLHAPVLRNPGHPLPPPVLHELPELLEGEAISAGRRHPPPPLAGGAPPPASGGGLATPVNDRVNKNIQCQDKKKKLFNDRLILPKIF